MDTSEDHDETSGITRGELLKAAAVAAPGLLLGGPAAAGAAARAHPQPRPPSAAGGIAGMNVLVFLTDQQRAVQHFPRGWTERNMPGLTRLQRHGMLFDNAFTNGKVPDQWEMYDLKADPLERTNLAYKRHRRTPEQQRHYRRLRLKLAGVERARLQPLRG
jgi:hypothetical protein